MACKDLTPDSIVTGALALIGRPAKLINRQGDLYDILGNVLEPYRVRMQIHDGNFILKKRIVVLPAGRLEVTISEPNWGRPVYCDLDPASLPAGIVLPRRDVNLINLEDQDLYRNNSFYGSTGAGLTSADRSASIPLAQAVSWFRDTETNTIKFFFEFGGFVPAMDGTYRFFYEPGGIAQVLEAQNIDWLPNFVGLLQSDFALAVLPLSDIPEPQYTRLEKRLQAVVMKGETLLDQWLIFDHKEQSGYVGGYNRSRVGAHRRTR